MEPGDPVSVIFFIIACLSFFGTLYVDICLFEKAQTTINARLLLYLNVTLTIESIATLPYIFTWNHGLCKFVAWIHTYCSMGNMTATLLLTLYFVNNVYSTDYVISRFIQRWKTVMVVVCPLMTALAFIGDAYGEDHQYWCSITLSTPQSFAWGVSVFYVWIWIAMVCCIILVTKVLLAMRKLQGSGRDVFSTVGLFVYAGVGLWIPRTFRKFYVWLSGSEFSPMEYALMTLPIYITGILYTIIFMYDKSVRDLEDIQFSRSSLSKGGFEFDWSEILPSFSANPGQPARDSTVFPTQSISNPIRSPPIKQGKGGDHQNSDEKL